MDKILLEMRHIVKEFPGVKALNDVNIKVKQGEIHCLVGENGAGKSTLMKVLSGVYPYGEYSGDVLIDGEIQKFTKISDSKKAGVAIIYQELALIPDMSIYENIFLGQEIKRGSIINWDETVLRATEILKRVKLKENPETKIRDLGVGKQQLVEIAKALSKDIKLLILDEPTAALNEDDSENLLELLRDLKSQGVTCIMISHKLKEVISIADTATVLRDGRSICTLDGKKGQITENALIKNMVGREIDNIYPRRTKKNIGDKVFEIKNWNAYDSKAGKKILHDINLNIKKGEIIGISGLMGAGRTELALSIFGNPRNYKLSGELFIDGKVKKVNHPKEAINAGIAYVTENRKDDGLILIKDIKENITISNLRAIAKQGVLDSNKEVKVANDYKVSLNIKAPSIEQKVSNLSGGNQQKVSLGKWLFVKPKVLILDEPTRGIDVGAKYEIYTIMNKLVQEGMCIIMISSELPEVLGMSDRIYVVSNGRITAELSTEEATQENIMTFATI